MQRTREYPIQIRVTESEKRRLQRNARACRMSLSAYMRAVGLGKEIRPFPTKSIHSTVASVSCGTNIRIRISTGSSSASRI